MITFQIEGLDQYWLDAPPLWEEQNQEVGLLDEEFFLDRPSYECLYGTGQLQVLTARQDGKMIGYVLLVIRQHPHFRVICAFEDCYFLTKSARKGWTGVKMLQEAMKFARMRGVKRFIFYSTLRKDLREFFAFLGFKHTDEVWSKVE